MPSMYRNVSTGLWEAHKYFFDLDAEAKYVYMYIITSRFSSELSAFPFPMKIHAPVLGLSEERFLEIFENLMEKGVIIYDNEAAEVLVVNYFENHSPNAGIRYEMYRNDLREIKSEMIVDALVEIATKYEITLAFYAALADRRPELEREEIMSQYKFRDKEIKPLNEVRGLARKGRENR